MASDRYDVVIVGAGADGPATAWRLGQAGLDVLVLEAGPWHGNENWPNPHEDGGRADASSDPDDLSGALLDRQFTRRELEMLEKLLWGPADHSRGYWARKFPQDGALLQCAGVGGTTLVYTACHPRAYPASVDELDHWPIDYADLVPYYRALESFLSIGPAPVTAKEELFFEGADGAGWDVLTCRNVTEPGYRPQPNAVYPPDQKLAAENYKGNFRYRDADNPQGIEGSTLAGAMITGNPHPIGAPVEEKAKRASNTSLVPAALETGSVTVRPNAFVTDVATTTTLGTPTATGVEFRDTWDGTTEQVAAEVVVLAAGAVETPRLWLNSGLPHNEWVGRGLTLHYPDHVLGFWTESDLEERLGQPSLEPHKGQNIAARLDHPGLGFLMPSGVPPGMTALLAFGEGEGQQFQHDTSNEPWDSTGRIAGARLKQLMADYEQLLPVLVVTDDRPKRRNGVTTAPGISDEHGPIPQVNYEPGAADERRRTELARIATEVLREAGATHVHRSDSPPAGLHIMSTMRMGKVVDTACEAHDVDRLFVADHSVLANSVGGPNPTHTGQALAVRTADHIVERYFPRASTPPIEETPTGG